MSALARTCKFAMKPAGRVTQRTVALLKEPIRMCKLVQQRVSCRLGFPVNSGPLLHRAIACWPTRVPYVAHQDGPGRLATNLPDNACHLDAVCLICLRPQNRSPRENGIRSCVLDSGYRMRPGWHWKDEYLVWDMTDFAHYDFSSTHPALGTRLNSPHVTCRVHMHEGRLTFPLKAEYDRAHSTCLLYTSPSPRD